MSRRAVATVLGLVVAAGLVLGAFRVAHVHEETGAWSLTWPERPPVLHELGRHYRLGGAAHDDLGLTGTRVVGAPGGRGWVLLPPAAHGSVPTVILLVDEHHDRWTYSLVGGP